MVETPILRSIMLTCGRGAVRLWRNNVGMLKNAKGNRVRYGLCNPGGSDLIGFRSVVVTPAMVGSRIAQFVAVEVKAGKNAPNKNQRDFLRIVDGAGGRAIVAYSVEDAERGLA